MKRTILTKSCVKYRERQHACSTAWVNELWVRGVDVRIVEGGDRPPMIAECLIGVQTGDGYNNNSIKLREALRLLLTTDFTHVFIVDDDTFVHPDRWLAHEPAGEFECRLYQPQSPRDHKLNYGRPWATGGSGWWMARRLCELYVATITTACSWDDVLATAVAQDAGAEIVDRPDLYGGDRYTDRLDRVSVDNRLITSHHVDADEMLKLGEAMRGL